MRVVYNSSLILKGSPSKMTSPMASELTQSIVQLLFYSSLVMTLESPPDLWAAEFFLKRTSQTAIWDVRCALHRKTCSSHLRWIMCAAHFFLAAHIASHIANTIRDVRCALHGKYCSLHCRVSVKVRACGMCNVRCTENIAAHIEELWLKLWLGACEMWDVRCPKYPVALIGWL